MSAPPPWNAQELTDLLKDGGRGGTMQISSSHARGTDDQPEVHAPSPPTITPRQQRALQALLTGGTDTYAAEAADVTRENLNRWRHRDANFIAALNQARQDLAHDFHDRLRALLPDALTTLRDGLASENINTRLRTATTLLRALRDIGEPTGPTNPEAMPSPSSTSTDASPSSSSTNVSSSHVVRAYLFTVRESAHWHRLLTCDQDRRTNCGIRNCSPVGFVH
jgi:hypothetical protein